MPPRAWVKLILTLFCGFLLGIILGFTSSALLFYLMPPQWLENGFQDRKSRYETTVSRRACRKDGFVETFYKDTNRVEVCACWPDGGAHTGAGVMVSCWSYERSGYSELGI